jgi:alpha-N-arabinofuranosidase
MGQLRRTRPIQIAMDEWNANDLAWGIAETIPDLVAEEGEYLEVSEQQFALKDALFAAGVFHAMFRECRHVTMANVAQMVNFLGILRTAPDGLLLTPMYHVFDLYSNHTGAAALRTSVRAQDGGVPSFTAEDWRYPSPRNVGLRRPFRRFLIPDIPFLDAQASRSQDGRTLYLSVINYHPDEALAAHIDLGQPPALPGSATVVELNGEDTHTPNSFQQPDVTHLTARTIAWPFESYHFPAHSATVFEIPLRP